MLRINNIPLALGAADEMALETALRQTKLKRESVQRWRISKKSVDARDKGDIRFVVSVDIEIKGSEEAVLARLRPGVAVKADAPTPVPAIQLKRPLASRPVVVGLGPCGLFAGLMLARAGARPIILERGQRVDERAKTVERFASLGDLNPESNVQFGEGGAGAFSDGKLTTGIKDARCGQVLYELAAHGAPEEILYRAHPHIGTDHLPTVVKNIREEILSLGGDIHFNSRLTEILTKFDRLYALRFLENGETREIACEQMILAIGHSASDTQQMLFSAGVHMTQKPFSVGARVEHPQALINAAQYGKFAKNALLGAAEYRLNCKLPDGRGAYTFCMCPGGVVVPAASRVGGVCVNGMSAFARDGVNANAAVLVDVKTTDFPDDHPLAGYVLQRAWEQRAFRAGGENYRAPAQLVGDLLTGRESKALGAVTPTYRPGVALGDLKSVLPDFAYQGIREAIKQFDRRLHGFALPDALLTGVETRSSCPVRVTRGDTYESSVQGVYPAGEGAGYAGGIMSAAVDGLRVAEAVLAEAQIG